MKKDNKFQQQQLNQLRSGEAGVYEEASIYTILLDLVQGNSLDEVFLMLHDVATDLGQRKELEDMFEDAKKLKWT